MKFKKSRLEQIVREELVNYIGSSLSEAPKKPDVEDADSGKKGKKPDAKTEPQADPDNITTRPKATGKPAGEPKGAPPVQDLPDEPADDELDADVTDTDDSDEPDETDPDDEAKSDISDDITGKTIQSITMEPKSKMMPGAQEINLTFKEVTDTLRILVSKTGQVKWYWRGLHNTL